MRSHGGGLSADTQATASSHFFKCNRHVFTSYLPICIFISRLIIVGLINKIAYVLVVKHDFLKMYNMMV